MTGVAETWAAPWWRRAVDPVGGRIMYRIAAVVLLLLPALPAARADDTPKQTPEEQCQAMAKDYQAKLEAFQKALQDARTLQERQQVMRDKYPQPNKLAPKFLALAEKNPKDPVAAEALAWVVSNTESQGRAGPGAKALATLARDYVTSPHVGPACLALTGALGQKTEAFLRAVLDKNPSRDVQGAACVALAQYLKNRNNAAQTMKDRPQLAANYASMLGKDYYLELVKLDSATADKEVEELLEIATNKYGDIKIAGGTVGEKAKTVVASAAAGGNPEVGKPAPEIEGEDIDGKKFKLSDYRGKVVLLDFWGNW
jgi:tetratricopeptide (TPR) repeat protein